MKVSPPVPDVEGPRSLTDLATDVRAARQVVHARRMDPVIRQDLVLAHHSLLQTMEAYVSELTARHLPIPHRLRDELRLQRDLADRPAGRRDPPQQPPDGMLPASRER